MYPEKLPVYMAGEGFRILPTIMTTSLTKRLVREVKTLVILIVVPAMLQTGELMAMESTVTERQVGVPKMAAKSLGNVTSTTAEG